MEIIYGDLRRLAGSYMRKALTTNLLRPTELVHEAYLKVVDQDSVDWRGRSHFFAVCARAMRQILVDDARRRGRQKRGGGCRRIALDDALTISAQNHEDVLVIHDALNKLATLNTRRATIVEMRFFAGMTMAEVAEALGVSKRTVEAHWTLARAWLRRELTKQDGKHESEP
jgi:RNA polymerase sigma factor (TIGR02999 family)